MNAADYTGASPVVGIAAGCIAIAVLAWVLLGVMPQHGVRYRFRWLDRRRELREPLSGVSERRARPYDWSRVDDWPADRHVFTPDERRAADAWPPVGWESWT